MLAIVLRGAAIFSIKNLKSFLSPLISAFDKLISASLFAISDSASLLSNSTIDSPVFDYDSFSLLCFYFNTKLSAPKCFSSSFSDFFFCILSDWSYFNDENIS